MASNGATRNLAAIVGSNIRAARLALRLSQNDLAQRMGGKASLMQVSAWERGINRPGDQRLVQIAEILEREVAWFFTEHDDDKAAA